MALRKNVSHRLQIRPAKRILNELCKQAEHAQGAYEIDFTVFTDKPAQHDPDNVNVDDVAPHKNNAFADQAGTHHQVVHPPLKEE